MIWFTADTHFAHTKILGFCRRPWNTIEEMDAALITNWNELVGVEDTVYHLGDFVMGSAHLARKYFGQLKGNIRVIPGSHDKRWIKSACRIYSKSGYEVFTLAPLCTITPKVGGKQQPIVLCHYAMKVWDRSHFNSWQLYGHSHGRLPGIGKQYDVGVDNNHYHPISLTALYMRMQLVGDNPNYVGKRRKGNAK